MPVIDRVSVFGCSLEEKNVRKRRKRRKRRRAAPSSTVDELPVVRRDSGSRDTDGESAVCY